MSREYLDYLHDLFSAFAAVTTRAMFGGHGVYRDGVIIALVIDETLYLKVDDATRAAFEAEGSAPFVYEAKGKVVPLSYWSTPEAALDSPQDFRPWAQRAWEAALRKPKPKAKKKAAKKSKGKMGSG
ncbi:MAG TPA: TfoX/Sxy family protein [Thermomonas sp.]|nr:TfoX/Sxy family protein [Thermomonas sp.]